MTYKKFSNQKYLIAITALSIIFGSISANAATININDGETRNTFNDTTTNDLLFTGKIDGVLRHTVSNTRTFGDISTVHNGVGEINISNNSPLNMLIVNGNIGKINTIRFTQSGSTLGVNGNFLFAENIVTDAIGAGNLFLGDGITGSDITVSSNIGALGSEINWVSTRDNSKSIFNGNIHIFTFEIKGGATSTINGLSNSLGSIGNLGTLNINQNTSASSYNNDDNTAALLNIAEGKKLNIISTIFDPFDDVSNISHDVTFGQGASIASNFDINVNSTAKFKFDYSTASKIAVNDSYQFFTVTDGTFNEDYDEATNTSDTSFLIKAVVDPLSNGYKKTDTLDNANLATLTTSEQSLVKYLVNETGVNSDNGGAQTAILKLGDATNDSGFVAKHAVEEALATLEETSAQDRSNMAQRTTQDITNAMQGIVDNRVHAVNYIQFALADKRKRPVANNNRIFRNGGTWGEVFGARSTQNDIIEKGANNRVKGYSANFGGVSFGADTIFRAARTNHIFGGAVAYAQGKADSNGMSDQKTDITSYQVSLYNYNARKNGLGFFNENSVNGSFNQYDSKRIIMVGNAYQSQSTAEYSGIGYGAKVAVGYNARVSKKVIFAPLAAIKYSGLEFTDYNERNTGGMGQRVESERFNLFTSELGVRVSGDVNLKVRPQVNVSWLHNLNNTGPKTTSYSGNGSNRIVRKSTGVNPDDDILNLGTQLNFRTGANSTFMVKYDLQKSENFTSHLGSLKYNLMF
ncbi:MAG: outer rane autotransporter barrel domain protein [Rickettsiaceae bacterium]|jgi:uncharacterized protein YhjY with autotransporter beta-barrel domain|nr:outer rane autotransporter barrel domain protein [Rickettsiaceae bacterium]